MMSVGSVREINVCKNCLRENSSPAGHALEDQRTLS